MQSPDPLTRNSFFPGRLGRRLRPLSLLPSVPGASRKTAPPARIGLAARRTGRCGELRALPGPPASPGQPWPPPPPGSWLQARPCQPDSTARELSCPEAPGTSGHTHPAPTHSQTRTPGRRGGAAATQESGSQRGGRLEEAGWTAASPDRDVATAATPDPPLRLVGWSQSVHFSPSGHLEKFGGNRE